MAYHRHGSVEEADASVSVRQSAQRPDGTKPCWTTTTVVGKLNRIMIGWANYFCLGPVSKAYRAVEQHARKRLRQWLCAKHKLTWPATRRYPEAALARCAWAWSVLPSGLAAFRGRHRDPFSESRMRENRLSGSMSGMWKRSMAELVRHRQTKGPATDRLAPKPPRHISTPHRFGR